MSIDKGEMYKESNKAAMEYAKNAIQFAFLLNGAAATAMFAKAGTSFLCAASFFALGACSAVFCTGLTYLVQLALCETWRQEKEPYDMFILGKWRKVTLAQIEWSRTVAIALWIISMFIFIIGTIVAATT